MLFIARTIEERTDYNKVLHNLEQQYLSCPWLLKTIQRFYLAFEINSAILKWITLLLRGKTQFSVKSVLALVTNQMFWGLNENFPHQVSVRRSNFFEFSWNNRIFVGAQKQLYALPQWSLHVSNYVPSIYQRDYAFNPTLKKSEKCKFFSPGFTTNQASCLPPFYKHNKTADTKKNIIWIFDRKCNHVIYCCIKIKNLL